MRHFTDRKVLPLLHCMVVRAHSPSVGFYKFLYGAVGKNWFWVNRLFMEETMLGSIISDPLVEIYVLYISGVLGGYVEFDRRIQGEVELAYFGLVPEFIGRGYGKYLLYWATKRAWSYDPTRVWLHTCELDHPAALSNYLKAGFVIYKEETVEQLLPE